MFDNVTRFIGIGTSNRYISSGVFTDKGCGTNGQNHEMVAVGYATDTNGIDFWLIIHSIFSLVLWRAIRNGKHKSHHLISLF